MSGVTDFLKRHVTGVRWGFWLAFAVGGLVCNAAEFARGDRESDLWFTGFLMLLYSAWIFAITWLEIDSARTEERIAGYKAQIVTLQMSETALRKAVAEIEKLKARILTGGAS